MRLHLYLDTEGVKQILIYLEDQKRRKNTCCHSKMVFVQISNSTKDILTAPSRGKVKYIKRSLGCAAPTAPEICAAFFKS